MPNSYGDAPSIAASTAAEDAPSITASSPSGIARTYERTDEQTDKHSTQVDISPDASPANEADDDEFWLEDRREGGHDHDGLPHVYVFYWPEFGIIKVGITEQGERRWNRWYATGGELVYIGETCCMEHARRIETIQLNVLADVGARAFTSAEDGARWMLGAHGAGWTECYRLVQSPRKGEPPEHAYDFERAYGLILPSEFATEFHNCDLVPLALAETYRPKDVAS